MAASQRTAAVPLKYTTPDTAPGSALESKGQKSSAQAEEVSVCVIGGGVSGLTAAITAAELMNHDSKIVLLEASPTLGGRVQSDTTDDGYTLDRGFAVFIEAYPVSKVVLDYDKLKLGKFLPGALINKLARVSDPLRRPQDIFGALFAPVGSIVDKIRTVPLLAHVFRKSVDELFQESETDTLSCLKERWGFGPDIVDKFLKPFLEGIYLAPLQQQSSRMFHFVFKMFSVGSACLPAGGMGAVAKQLEENAAKAGVEIRVGKAVSSLRVEDGWMVVQTKEG
eukprot:CAMPEP_0170641528 /NCGR_PEP_ID=MMETSP0224-20130122/40818_1 /TAXON_ID=285029 /ORGANISM="Togula jolla, Strain CCCM 725" /LENGTH=280 /DNA_ID=CAMNT_0010972131 /DNA_START=115 /DNA_END=954 /DNA_ORIENTATION=-